MNIRRHRRAHAGVETSALNDIMFFLMLFFLIASTLANPNVIKLLLPQAKAGQTVSKQQYSITISKDLEYYYNNSKQSISFGELEGKLAQLNSESGDLTFVLKVDRNIQVQHLVDVLSLGTKYRLKMILATQAPK